MKNKRALRRHNLDKKKRKSKMIYGTTKYANHLHMCSSYCCGNPRHHFKGNEKITMQEIRSSFRYEEMEFEDNNDTEILE